MKTFFECTKSALDRITSTFDLVWPLASGLWNLRCSVNGIMQEYPAIKARELAAKFSVGSGLHGVNYKRAFFERKWHEQQQDLALILLNGLFPVYEEWINAIKDKLNINLAASKLQFPQDATQEITRCIPNKSKSMHEFFITYCNMKDRSVQHIDNYLYCYRVFKEARNCYIHRGGVADTRLCQVYSDYQQGNYNTCQALDVKEVPVFLKPQKDKPIDIDLRGIVGFSSIIIKLILSIETCLIEAPEAEAYFIKKCQSKKLLKLTLSSDKNKRTKQIKQYIRKCGFEKTEHIDDIELLLLQNNLISN